MELFQSSGEKVVGNYSDGPSACLNLWTRVWG